MINSENNKEKLPKKEEEIIDPKVDKNRNWEEKSNYAKGFDKGIEKNNPKLERGNLIANKEVRATRKDNNNLDPDRQGGDR